MPSSSKVLNHFPPAADEGGNMQSVRVAMHMAPGSGLLWWQKNMRESMTSHCVAVFACRSREAQSVQSLCFMSCLPAVLWSLLAPVCRMSPVPTLFPFLKFTKALANPEKLVSFKFCSLLRAPAPISLIILSKGTTELGGSQSCPNPYCSQEPALTR